MAPQVAVGMDLGSCKTAVMTSDGRRAVIPTVVGRPKDAVSRRLLKSDAIFGNSVIQNRHSLNIIRPLAHGNLKFVFSQETQEAGIDAIQRESLERIVEHAFSLVGVEHGTSAVSMIGVPALASVESKELIKQVAEQTCGSAMVVSEPFAVAYGMDCLTDTLMIDIGAGTTDICALTGVFPPPEHQLTLSMGGDSVDEWLLKLVRSHHPDAICSLQMLQDVKERHGSITEDAALAVVTVVVNGRQEVLNVAKQLRQACQMIVDPIFNGIKDCLSVWDSETQSRLLRNVILAGGGSRMGGLDARLESLLCDYYGAARVSRVHDSMFAGAAGALQLAMEMPPECWTSAQKAA